MGRTASLVDTPCGALEHPVQISNAGSTLFGCTEELKQKIGQFDAEFLLDFMAQELAAYFYNRGLYDAQTLLSDKVEDLQDLIYQLEQPTEFKKDAR